MKNTPAARTVRARVPRILVAEDDPTSLAFLLTALRDLPAEVDGAANMAAALDLAARHRYDLWLFDAHLPDGSGADLLGRANRVQPEVVAVAHTASNDMALRCALLTAGFRSVMTKPLPASAVRETVRRELDSLARPLWNDRAAAAALNGNTDHVAALRQLFLAELPLARQKILQAAHDNAADALGSELHKLQASCGFVGAARIAEAVRSLQLQLADEAALHRFDCAVLETLEHPEEAATEPGYS